MAFPSLGLAERVAVVVGGTSGIGRALSLALAEAGAHVVATGRRADAVAETATEIESRGLRSLRVTTDVTDRASLQVLFDATLREFGRVDVLVNSAGRTKRAPTLEVTDDDWRAILDTNLEGTLRACQIFGRHMIGQRYGRIVNVASLSSFIAFHEVAAYTASKAAVAALTKSLAVEWARHGVCVNAIAPGVVRTALNAQLLDGTPRGKELLMRTPAGRFGAPEEIAGACVFLASEAAAFVNGHVLVVDGGILASGVNQ